MTKDQLRVITRVKGFERNGCHIWGGSIFQMTGYGYIHTIVDGKRKKISAHRLSYRAFKGEIEVGKVVRHSCDVKPCVNPDHLSLGTHKENTGDSILRNRHVNVRKTHCTRGHEYPPVRYREDGTRVYRHCMTCVNTVYVPRRPPRASKRSSH